MNIGLLGGTFDPIHRGHIALARAAKEQFKLGRTLFVPAGAPPHKQRQPLTPYIHRYAMAVLAVGEEKTFVPSLLEAPETSTSVGIEVSRRSTGRATPAVNYTIDTVRRLKHTLSKSDRLFFLIGIDAFNEIATWHEAKALLRECDFIVASRPGFSLADVADALPEELRPKAAVSKAFAKHPARGDLALAGVTVHLLENVHHNISATSIREAVAAKKPLTKFVDPAVAEYIKKVGLYQSV